MNERSATKSPEAEAARRAVIARALVGFSAMSSGSQAIVARADMKETYRRYTEYVASLTKAPT